MIINNQVIEPDLWEEIKDLEIIAAIDYLYHLGFFDNIPTTKSNGEKYESIFHTGAEIDFNLLNLYDLEPKIRQTELLIKLKYKYKRNYEENLACLHSLYDELRVINVLHE